MSNLELVEALNELLQTYYKHIIKCLIHKSFEFLQYYFYNHFIFSIVGKGYKRKIHLLCSKS